MTSGKECINKSLIKLLSSDSKEDWKVAFMNEKIVKLIFSGNLSDILIGIAILRTEDNFPINLLEILHTNLGSDLICHFGFYRDYKFTILSNTEKIHFVFNANSILEIDDLYYQEYIRDTSGTWKKLNK